jgi:GT2 family glycosyltransferase
MLPITAIIPTLNRPALCLKAVQSVYEQSRPPLQVIVVDDGSTEELTEVQDLLARSGGLYLRQENKGVSAARNLGVEYATQDWLAFLDSDDQWLPHKLEKQYALHQADTSLSISHTAEIWINNGVRVKQRKHHAPAEGRCFERCLEICCISASALMIRRDVFDTEGGFDVMLPVCEDYDFWIRLTRNYAIGLVPESLVLKTRDSGPQLSSAFENIDQYRVQALTKLLDSEITATEARQVKNALGNKLSILEKGALKRGLMGQVALYKAIRANY